MEEHRMRLGKDREWLDREWRNINHHQGSVQQLDYITDWEKLVFKTAFEIDQEWVVQHAGDRQPHICQGQSVNLFFPAGSDKSYVNRVHLKAWKSKLKGLYYLRTSATSNAENVGQKVERVALKNFMEDTECLACEG
jgi:ribonucleoside-diphosphate reductase alpha chain